MNSKRHAVLDDDEEEDDDDDGRVGMMMMKSMTMMENHGMLMSWSSSAMHVALPP